MSEFTIEKILTSRLERAKETAEIVFPDVPIQVCDELMEFNYCDYVGTDETGHNDSGRKFWTWCQQADGVAFFRTCDSRGSKVLLENLSKDFNSILLADYYSANRMFVY